MLFNEELDLLEFKAVLSITNLRIIELEKESKNDLDNLDCLGNSVAGEDSVSMKDLYVVLGRKYGISTVWLCILLYTFSRTALAFY